MNSRISHDHVLIVLIPLMSSSSFKMHFFSSMVYDFCLSPHLPQVLQHMCLNTARLSRSSQHRLAGFTALLKRKQTMFPVDLDFGSILYPNSRPISAITLQSVDFHTAQYLMMHGSLNPFSK